MTTKNTLMINFFATGISTEKKVELMTAINHEETDMRIKLTDDNISRTQKRIDSINKDITENGDEDGSLQKMLDAKTAELAALKDEKVQLESDLASTLEVYTKVVDNMSTKNKDGFGNKKDVVRTVLRVLASYADSKLVKYAIIPAFQSPELYNALETIHITSKASEDGALVMSKDVKEAYKTASKELESIIKNTFSLPFETDYTDKTRVKMNADDKKLLNDCYIKGFTNKFTTDDNGNVSFKTRQVNTLVKAKKDKKSGKITYDYSGLANTIANIVLKHYFA